MTNYHYRDLDSLSDNNSNIKDLIEKPREVVLSDKTSPIETEKRFAQAVIRCAKWELVEYTPEE